MWGKLVKGFGIYKDGAYEQIILFWKQSFFLVLQKYDFYILFTKLTFIFFSLNYIDKKH